MNRLALAACLGRASPGREDHVAIGSRAARGRKAHRGRRHRGVRDPAHLGRIPRPRDRPGGARSPRSAHHPDGHARRSRHLHAPDHQADPDLRGPRGGLRRALRKPRGLGGHVHHVRGARGRDGAGHLDRRRHAGERGRGRHPEGPGPQGKERRGELHPLARERSAAGTPTGPRRPCAREARFPRPRR